MNTQLDTSKTDLAKELRYKLAVLEERVNGTSEIDLKWHEHWKTELEAVNKALDAVETQY